MRKATLYRYRLAMDSGVILRDARLSHREGFVVSLTYHDKSALGEIAPLFGFSHESLDDACEQAKSALLAWTQGKQISLNSLYPSVSFGLSVALAELEGKLPADGNFQIAPLCSGDPDELVEKLSTMPEQKIAKIKVGMFEPIRDGMVVNMLLEAIPELYLRLDANQQWRLEKALKFADYVAPSLRHRISFIEEPCQSKSESLEFAKQTGIAIAWDEHARLDDFKPTKEQGVSAIVIKPSLVGSLDKVAALVQAAHQQGLQAVISSSLESSIGLNHLARIAKALTPNTLSGLDTLSLFAAQLETPWPKSTLPLVSLRECDILWQSN